MCGIVGYAGARPAEPILIEGLRRLEYRGYDSSGVATLERNRLTVRKKAGRIAELAGHLKTAPSPGPVGIGHTRWATHGPPSDRNAHPHVSYDGRVALVHNGVIENYAQLRRRLQDDGVEFKSDTDTEVIAHLIARHLEGDLAEAVDRVLPLLKGTYGLAVVSPVQPGLIVGARLGSPLVIGIGDGETFLASDAIALAGRARQAAYLADGQTCVLTARDWRILDREKETVAATIHDLAKAHAEIELGHFDHYMLKEIYEQPEALENALRGRLDDADATARFGGLNLDSRQLRDVDRIILTACGTSYHAA
ncbi:MAG: isomerizing glutamine--fructose-6-phosphate transaminase, partial [Gemmataceae bacterium]